MYFMLRKSKNDPFKKQLITFIWIFKTQASTKIEIMGLNFFFQIHILNKYEIISKSLSLTKWVFQQILVWLRILFLVQ